MAINQGSILDHVDKPAIHPDDAIVQTLTPTSNGKVAKTVNGQSVTDYVHAKGLIKAAGSSTADSHLALKNAVKSGESCIIQNTNVTHDDLIIKNQDGTLLTSIPPGKSETLTWVWTSSSAGEWFSSSSQTDLAQGVGKFQVFDDFVSEETQVTDKGLGLWFASAGSDGDATAAAHQDSPEGVAMMGSGDGNGTEDGSVLCLRTLARGALVSEGGIVFETRVALDALTGCSQWIGLSDVLGTNAERLPHTVDSGTVADGGLTVTNVAGFSFSSDATATTCWTITSEKAGAIGNSEAEEALDVGPTADTYQILRIEVDADGTIRYYVDGVLKSTRSEGIATTAVLIPLIGMDSGTDAQVVRDLSIDYILFEGNRPASNA